MVYNTAQFIVNRKVAEEAISLNNIAVGSLFPCNPSTILSVDLCFRLQCLLKGVKKSLINTDRSIKQIAADHNFTEVNLCKLFKSKVGYSTTEYRSNKDVIL